MNVNQINSMLLSGNIDNDGVFPHLESLKLLPIVFPMNTGLPQLGDQPGIILIRGARQYGKSTWLEQNLRQSIVEHGAGSAFYLNGDEVRNSRDLIEQIRSIVSLFPKQQSPKRIFIDEITAVTDWQRALKRLADSGEIRDILIVTTGSKAGDLRRGTERLPGRKGRLDRSSYFFPQLSYKEFLKAGKDRLKGDTLVGYILSGGCPIAAIEIIKNKVIPEFIVEMIRDWIYGEIAAANRDRSSLLGVLESICRFGGTPCGQAKLAREAGLANNTVASGYVELLMDLLCVGTATSWDHQKKVFLRRKPAKYHFTNLLVAASWHPDRPVSIADFNSLSPQTQGVWYEWVVAQELWRRAAIRGDESPEQMAYWRSSDHEIDFVVNKESFIEVKRGACSPMEFTWFAKMFPGAHLIVVNANRFDTAFCTGITLQDFLLESGD